MRGERWGRGGRDSEIARRMRGGEARQARRTMRGDGTPRATRPGGRQWRPERSPWTQVRASANSSSEVPGVTGVG